MSCHFVYGLFDPVDWNAIRYIGVASSLKRPIAHEVEALRMAKNSYKLNWIRAGRGEGREGGGAMRQVVMMLCLALLAAGCADVAPKRVARVEPAQYVGWGTWNYVESTDGYWCFTSGGSVPTVGSLLANCDWKKGTVARPAEKEQP